jgi:hypothetical protein
MPPMVGPFTCTRKPSQRRYCHATMTSESAQLTAVYLGITPGLLGEANRRFEAFAQTTWLEADP